MSKTIYIGGRLESKEKGNVVTGANAILDDTKGKKQNVINKETDDELLRLEQSKQDNLNFDNTPTEDSTNPVTSGGVYTAEKALSDAIEAILLLIPSAATALNKLVDTNTMNSSISTATATFRGTYNAVSDLGLTYQATHAQIEAALDALGLTADNNDFVFVQIPVSDQSQDIAKTERFKFNGTNWLYEYDLNTSGFTAAQWAAINSGITVALVTKLTDLPTAAALQLALNAKQDTLTFDNEPTALSQNPVTSGGIYLAIQAVATALSNYSDTTDGRLNTLEGLVPTEASSSNKLTDKAYVDGLIQAITELIPAEADTTNQLADKAYVLAQILAATPAFKGQFTTLAELQAVASPKAGDLGIVRTKDSDGMDVFTVYQYLNNAWNVFYSLSYHPQTKPATTGTTGDYPYNGMGRVELAKNMVNTGTELAPTMVNQLTQDMFYKGAVGSRVPNTNTIFVIKYDYVLGEDITIPDNCVLNFDGGSIIGAYTLTGQNTKIECGKTKIFNTNVLFDGSFSTRSLDVRNFGAVGDNVTDDTNAFKAALRFLDTAHDEYSNTGIQPSRVMKGGTLYIPNGIYKITDTLTVKSQSYIIGESAEGVVLESTANVGIQLEGLTYNGSPYIHNVRLSNFFLKMHGGKVGIKNNTNASLGDCVFSNFTIQSVEVGMLLKGLWNCKFEKVCIESVNFGVILTDNSTLGCNNNIINNLIVVSVNKCGLYLSSANGTYCTNLNIEGVGNTWAGDYAWCGDYSNISSTVDEVTYDVESPCAVYVAGTAYSNVFNCSWFEAIHATGTLAICYLIKNATSYHGVHRMSVTITDGYFNSDVDLPIKIATSAAVYLSRLNYWGNFANGSIAIDYADQAYIDISFVIKGWITNIVSAAGKVTKWVNIHHILDDYQNIVNNYTFQNLQGYQLERNYYDNKDYPAYSVYYGKQIDAARKIIYNYASDIVDGYDYGNKKYVSVNNGGVYEYKTTDNGVISIPGTFTYGGKFIVKLTALDSVGAAAIASGYYISNNVNDNLQVSFVTPPAANCNFNYFVDIVA